MAKSSIDNLRTILTVAIDDHGVQAVTSALQSALGDIVIDRDADDIPDGAEDMMCSLFAILEPNDGLSRAWLRGHLVDLGIKKWADVERLIA